MWGECVSDPPLPCRSVALQSRSLLPCPLTLWDLVPSVAATLVHQFTHPSIDLTFDGSPPAYLTTTLALYESELSVLILLGSPDLVEEENEPTLLGSLSDPLRSTQFLLVA